MIWLKAVCLGFLLIGSTYAKPDQYASNPFLHGFANDVNAFIQDQARLASVDTDTKENPSHSIANRAIDGYAAPTYLPPAERKLICARGQVCVSTFLCNGGFFTSDLPGSRQECIPDSEVCCSYRPPPPPPPPKPTTPPAVACLGRFETCALPEQCIGGLYQLNGLSTPPYAQRCYAPEVCCRIPDPEPVSLTDDGYVVRVPQNQFITPTVRPRPVLISTAAPPVYLPPDRIAQPTIIKGEGQLSLPINPPPKNTIDDPIANLPVTCAAALNCTAVEYCTATGVISKTPVALTPDQEAYRVPLTDCQDPVKGIIGKCCRDPDYVDPWPVSQLGQYTDPKLFGDDGQYRPAAAATRPRPAIAPKPLAPIRDQSAYIRPAAASIPAQQFAVQLSPSIAPKPQYPIREQSQYVQPIAGIPAQQFAAQLSPAIYPQPASCGVRNPNAAPSGPGPYDASFSEYPWQTMILREATKTILCGGVIVSEDLVVTSASCIQGYQPYDILVKAGEWKLGRDEEPLKFQLIRASKIDVNPGNGMALIYLEQRLKFAPHIAPICLDASDPTPADSCVTTGWGKQAISIHLQDAVMHHSPVSIISPDECAASGNGYGSICGRPQIPACELDEGSALACLNPQGQYVMKGIFLSAGQCGSNSPTISFARPDLGWIKGNAPAAVNQIASYRPITNEYLPPRH